jgi:ligand-binding SRPBCC domain-containing protein
MTAPSASAHAEIDAPAETVYALISDLPGLQRVAAEFQRGRWLDGVTEARAGARFRGTNKRSWHRWTTTVTVTDADPGRRFAFDVTYYGVPISRWQYDFEPNGAGCTVRESTWDRRPGWFRPIGRLGTGVRDRADANRRNIERTLAQLKIAAERTA